MRATACCCSVLTCSSRSSSSALSNCRVSRCAFGLRGFERRARLHQLEFGRGARRREASLLVRVALIELRFVACCVPARAVAVRARCATAAVRAAMLSELEPLCSSSVRCLLDVGARDRQLRVRLLDDAFELLVSRRRRLALQSLAPRAAAAERPARASRPRARRLPLDLGAGGVERRARCQQLLLRRVRSCDRQAELAALLRRAERRGRRAGPRSVSARQPPARVIDRCRELLLLARRAVQLRLVASSCARTDVSAASCSRRCSSSSVSARFSASDTRRSIRAETSRAAYS